jgi:hypothetical protein
MLNISQENYYQTFFILLIILLVFGFIELIMVINLKYNNKIKYKCYDGDGEVLTDKSNQYFLNFIYSIKLFVIFTLFIILNFLIKDNLSVKLSFGIFLILIIICLFNTIAYYSFPNFIESKEACQYKKGYKRLLNSLIYKNLLVVLTFLFTFYCILNLIVRTL